MPRIRVDLTLEATLLDQVDSLVHQHVYENRSQAIEAAVREHLVRLKRAQLADACRLLDSSEERTLAEGWPGGAPY